MHERSGEQEAFEKTSLTLDRYAWVALELHRKQRDCHTSQAIHDLLEMGIMLDELFQNYQAELSFYFQGNAANEDILVPLNITLEQEMADEFFISNAAVSELSPKIPFCVTVPVSISTSHLEVAQTLMTDEGLNRDEALIKLIKLASSFKLLTDSGAQPVLMCQDGTVMQINLRTIKNHKQ